MNRKMVSASIHELVSEFDEDGVRETISTTYSAEKNTYEVRIHGREKDNKEPTISFMYFKTLAECKRWHRAEAGIKEYVLYVLDPSTKKKMYYKRQGDYETFVEDKSALGIVSYTTYIGAKRAQVHMNDRLESKFHPVYMEER